MQLRLRDLLILVVSLCGVLFSVSMEGEYSLGIIWSLPLDLNLWANGHFPLTHERLYYLLLLLLLLLPSPANTAMGGCVGWTSRLVPQW